MPIYEFKCQSCGKRFEELMKINGLSGHLTCPSCKGKNINKIVSKFSIAENVREGDKTKSSENKCSGCTVNSCSSCVI